MKKKIRTFFRDPKGTVTMGIFNMNCGASGINRSLNACGLLGQYPVCAGAKKATFFSLLILFSKKCIFVKNIHRPVKINMFLERDLRAACFFPIKTTKQNIPIWLFLPKNPYFFVSFSLASTTELFLFIFEKY